MAQNNGIFPLFVFRYLDLALYKIVDFWRPWITEVTEPASDYQSESVTPATITPTTEPGDDYPVNSPSPPPISEQQKNMPCESTILFEAAENQIRNEVEKEEIDEFEAAERQIQEEMEVDEPLPAKGAYNVDFDKFDDPSK